MKWKIDEAEDLPLAIIEDTEDGDGILEIGERTPYNLRLANQIRAIPELIDTLREFIKTERSYKEVRDQAIALLESIYGMPTEVYQAIMHVRKFHPCVCMVVYGKDTRWRFMDENFDAPVFSVKVDISILEDAQNVVEEFPAIFQL